MVGESRRLSETVSGAGTKAEFGEVSATGVGLPIFDVTQVGASPKAFIAVQPSGSAGGVTLSKFVKLKSETVPKEHGGKLGAGEGVGVGVGATVHSLNLKLPMRVRQLPGLVVA